MALSIKVEQLEHHQSGAMFQTLRPVEACEYMRPNMECRFLYTVFLFLKRRRKRLIPKECIGSIPNADAFEVLSRVKSMFDPHCKGNQTESIGKWNVVQKR